MYYIIQIVLQASVSNCLFLSYLYICVPAPVGAASISVEKELFSIQDHSGGNRTYLY